MDDKKKDDFFAASLIMFVITGGGSIATWLLGWMVASGLLALAAVISALMLAIAIGFWSTKS